MSDLRVFMLIFGACANLTLFACLGLVYGLRCNALMAQSLLPVSATNSCSFHPEFLEHFGDM